MVCDICGREETECRIRTIKGMNLCPKHLTQWYRHGGFSDRTIYDKNDIIKYDDHAEIVLRNKSGDDVGHAIIDLEDVEKCSQYKWHIRKGRNTNYAIASLPNNKKIHLHRFVLNYSGALDVDHRNRNGLDNRKDNLIPVTHSKNLINQGGDRGIKQVPSGRYQALITKDYRGIYLGTFDTYEDALQARLVAEQQYFQ